VRDGLSFMRSMNREVISVVLVLVVWDTWSLK